MPTSETMKSASVAPIVAKRQRIARSRTLRNAVITRPGSASCAWPFGFFRIETPISGAKTTATIQEMMSAMPTTAKSEKVYSPAELLAKPIGMKPATVTSVPVSIGNAVEV